VSIRSAANVKSAIAAMRWQIGRQFAKAGWRVQEREFTASCRSVFQLCEKLGSG
jgi:hypothetical protein